MKGVTGLASFANGCPRRRRRMSASMEYLRFKNASPYRTPQTIANFAFRRGSDEQEMQLVSYWLSWWNLNKASAAANLVRRSRADRHANA